MSNVVEMKPKNKFPTISDIMDEITVPMTQSLITELVRRGYSRISLDRSDCGIKNCRLSIGTTESRLVKHWIKYET